jgi:pimeloyl-ACP methyl ester carboxylesterase
MTKVGAMLRLCGVAVLLCAACTPVAGNGVRVVQSSSVHGVDHFTRQQPYNAHYIRAGQGPPVILIPGLFGTCRSWDRVTPLLATQHSVLAIDNFGTGESEVPEESFGYSIAEQADRIVRMMDELQIHRCPLVGSSYGGMIALNIAARYPERVSAVVCIEGAVIMPKETSFAMTELGLKYPIVGDTIIGFIRSGLFNRTMAKSIMSHAWDSLESDDQAEIAAIVSHTAKTATRRSWFKLAYALNHSPDFYEEAKQISAPVLYLYGLQSSYRDMTATNVDYFRTHLPHIQLVAFDDGIHDLHLQKPKEVAELIRGFLARQVPASTVAAPPAPTPHDEPELRQKEGTPPVLAAGPERSEHGPSAQPAAATAID